MEITLSFSYKGAGCEIKQAFLQRAKGAAARSPIPICSDQSLEPTQEGSEGKKPR